MNSRRQQQMSDEIDANLCRLVKTYNVHYGHGPTQAELVDELHYKSIGAIRNRLARLKAEGRITWQPGVARSLRTVEAS